MQTSFDPLGSDQALLEGFGGLITEWFKDTNPNDWDSTYTSNADTLPTYDDEYDAHPNRSRHDAARAARAEGGATPHFGPGGIVQSGLGVGAATGLDTGVDTGLDFDPDTAPVFQTSPDDLPMPPPGHPGLPDPPTGEPVAVEPLGLPDPPTGEPSIYSGDGSSVITTDPTDSVGMLPAPDPGGLPDIPEVPEDALYATGSEGAVREAITEEGISLDDRSALGGSRGSGGGSIEMQPMEPAAPTAQSIFDEYYSPDVDFSPTDAIADAFGVSRSEAVGSAFSDMQQELHDIWIEQDYYAGDGYEGTYSEHTSGVETYTATDEVSGDFVNMGDLPGGGEMEMVEITPGEPSTAPSFDESQPGAEYPRATAYGNEPLPPYNRAADGSPLMLDDVPGNVPDLTWEMVDPSMFGEGSEMFAGVLSDPSTMSLGSSGILSDLGAVGNFLKNRSIDLVVGTALQPLFTAVDDLSGTPWVSRGIQGTMAMYGLLAAGDPFGVIAAPICWGIQEYIQQRQRLLANNDPAAEIGKKFGYVREGNKWYPAIQMNKTRDEGFIGSHTSQVQFEYGNEIKWRKGKLGEWLPYFEEGQYNTKNFIAPDWEVDEPDGDAGKDYQRRVDPLRDFYYLTEEETDAYLSNVMGGDIAANADRNHEFTSEEQNAILAAQAQSYTDFGSNVHGDESWDLYWYNNGDDTERSVYQKRSGYVDQLQDIRQSLEFMQSYRYSNPGSLTTTDFGMDEFEGSQEFRSIVNGNGALGLAEGDNEIKACNPQMGCYRTGTATTDSFGRPEGYSANTVYADGVDKFSDSAEMRWLTDEYMRQRDNLYKAQKYAGLSKDFDKIFGKKIEDANVYYRDETGEYVEGEASRESLTGESEYNLQNSAWALYQDNTWEFGALDTTEQLSDAIAKIEASGDGEWYGTEHYRNDDQRTYLAQKAYTRYLFSKINQLGGYDYMNDTSFGDAPNAADMFFSDGSYQYRAQDDERYRGADEYVHGLSWALDPMYSEIDDGDDPAGAITYGSRYINHRDTWTDPGAYEDIDKYGQDTDNMYNLVKNGIIGTGKDNNPDYIAGNFADMLDYNAATHHGKLPYPWDPYQEAYVVMGTQTPGLIYNDDTGEYEIPEGWQEPGRDPVTNTWVSDVAWDEDNITPDFVDEQGADVDDSYVTQGGPISGVDYPDGFFYGEFNHEGVITAPDGSTFSYPDEQQLAFEYYDQLQQDKSDEEKKEAEDEKKKQEEEARKKQEEEDAQKQAEEDAAAAEQAQAEDEDDAPDTTVPVSTAGATHMHDEETVPTTPAPHYSLGTIDVPHWAHDPTMPTSIPMDVIASQIAEGVKVI